MSKDKQGATTHHGGGRGPGGGAALKGPNSRMRRTVLKRYSSRFDYQSFLKTFRSRPARAGSQA